MPFLYRLIAPRPTFARDMTDSERAVMGEHAAYLRERLARGEVVAFGPVDDPAGSWGLGLIALDDEAAARAIGESDPAVASGVCTFQLVPMLALVH